MSPELLFDEIETTAHSLICGGSISFAADDLD